MYLQPFGAVRTVTGSMHLLEVNGKKVLLDCGLYQGHREEAYDKNRTFPFPITDIDAVILSHAHIDHTGNLPTLVKQGYKGPVYSTFATRDLCSYMLQDTAHLQEMEVEKVNRWHQKKNLPAFKPLYVMADAVNALRLYHGIGFDSPCEIFPGIELTYRKAGHILGAAMMELNLTENGKQTKLVFTGDLGRKNMPILPDPYTFEEADVLLSESTYGDRAHEPMGDVDGKIEALIKEATEKKSKIIIPAFAVDRTQTFIYRLHKLCDAGRCYNIPIYVDSPLAVSVTDVYRLHPECYSEETHRFLASNGDPFGFARLQYTHSVEESKRLNNITGPVIIISASGMCEGGRVLHHLLNSVADPNNIIFMIGYCADGTLGRQIMNGAKQIKIFGEPCPLNAKVVVMDSFSGHADKNELLQFVMDFKKKPKQVILVHGEEQASLTYAETLKQNGLSATVPHPGDKFEL